MEKKGSDVNNENSLLVEKKVQKPIWKQIERDS